MKVTLYRSFPDLYRQSMTLYTNRLVERLHRMLLPSESINSYLPKNIHLVPPIRYWSQYIRYQLGAYFMKGDVNHIIDHSYAHLIHSLPHQRTVVTFHDAIGLKVQSSLLGILERKDHIRLIQRYNLAGLCKAARVICVSESAKKDFLTHADYPPEQIEVIHEGVDESFFKQHHNEPKRLFGLEPGHYILHVGHTRFYKNIPALFHTLSILSRFMGKDVKLLKIGEPFSSEQKKLASDLGVWERIIHLGRIADDHLPDAYHCADVLLFPSLHEGFGFPVVEAMASGIPVVTSNKGSLPEVVGDAGILVGSSDHKSMAEAIAAILERSTLRLELRAAGLKRARAFSWENTAKRTLQVYRRVQQQQFIK